MSMVMTLKQAPAETLELLVDQPELAIVFWMHPDYKPPTTPAWLLWIARLFGHYEPPMELPTPPANLARNGEECWLESEWHALTWLLSRPRGLDAGDEWDVEAPETALLTAGEPIAGSDHGYGDERAVDPQQASAFADAVTATPWEDLVSRFDPEALDAASIHPTGWADREAYRSGSDLDSLRDAHGRLRSFLETTRDESLGFVIQLS